MKNNLSSQLYAQYSVKDFDKFDCLKLSKTIYISLLFILRGYIIWIISVTNMRDRVAIIEWLFPDPHMFYLSLASGALGLYLVFILSLRRPNAANWVKWQWRHFRVLMIIALLFDLVMNSLGYFYWQLISIQALALQTVFTLLLVISFYKSKRIKINLHEFPKVVEQEYSSKKKL